MRDETERPRSIRLERRGPLMVEGPVTVTAEDGTTATSHRFMVAVCTCHRSRTLPWCDTSHRTRRAPAARDRTAPGTRTDADSDTDTGGAA